MGNAGDLNYIFLGKMVCRPTPNGAAPVVKLESFVVARICLQIRGNPSPTSSLRGFACKSAAIQKVN